MYILLLKMFMDMELQGRLSVTSGNKNQVSNSM